MKIHVLREGQDCIEGFRHVAVKDGVINFEDISDNQCELILAGDVLDEFQVDKIEECIGILLKKLRLGGTIIVGGTDLRAFCKNVNNCLLSKEEASGMICNCKSMTDINKITSIIRGAGLKVATTQTSGVHYEITAERR